MAQNKAHINTENVDEWMASTGFLFPRTIKELLRFEKLYKDIVINLDGCQIDPEIILGRRTAPVVIPISKEFVKKETHFRMAARKGDKNVPQHILNKIKMNQDKRKKDDSESEENSAQ